MARPRIPLLVVIYFNFLLFMFLEISQANITTMLGYVKGLIEDLTPLLLVILAVGLGIFILWAIISAIKS